MKIKSLLITMNCILTLLFTNTVFSADEDLQTAYSELTGQAIQIEAAWSIPTNMRYQLKKKEKQLKNFEPIALIDLKIEANGYADPQERGVAKHYGDSRLEIHAFKRPDGTYDLQQIKVNVVPYKKVKLDISTSNDPTVGYSFAPVEWQYNSGISSTNLSVSAVQFFGKTQDKLQIPDSNWSIIADVAIDLFIINLNQVAGHSDISITPEKINVNIGAAYKRLTFYVKADGDIGPIGESHQNTSAITGFGTSTQLNFGKSKITSFFEYGFRFSMQSSKTLEDNDGVDRQDLYNAAGTAEYLRGTYLRAGIKANF